MSTLHFYIIDEAAVDTTTAAWQEQISNAAGEVHPDLYSGVLDRIGRFAQGQIQEETLSFYYLASDSAPKEALAILDVSYALPGSPDAYLKLLSIYVAPRLDVSVQRGEDIRLLARIGAEAIVECLKLTYKEHPAQEFKVWGGQTLTVDMLSGVWAMLEEEKVAGLEPSRHGKWFVLKKE